MSFIGVICDTKFENYVRQTLKQKLQTDNIIIFSSKNIENFKNIKFEIVLIMSKKNSIFEKKEALKNIISKSKYLIINADEEINFDILENMNLNVLTYGFNSKSTITASSVKEEDIMLCIQRSIEDKKLEPQEINVKKLNSKTPTNIVMGLATALLLRGSKEFII